MLLQDIIEKRLIEAYRKDRSISKNRIRVDFSKIRLPQMYQKLNDQADAKATANAISYTFMDKDKKKRFYQFHSSNIIMSADPERKGYYNLICGLISYKTLEKVFLERKRMFDARKRAADFSDDWKEPTISAMVIDYPTREEFIMYLKDQYELSFRTDPGYLKIDDKQEYDMGKVNDDVIRLSEDKSYDLPIEAVQIDNTLYPISNIEFAVAVKRYNDSVGDKNKKDSVQVIIKSGQD